MAWTPYLVINYLGIFEGMEITPLFTIWGAVFAKTNACYNPIVYAIRSVKHIPTQYFSIYTNFLFYR